MLLFGVLDMIEGKSSDYLWFTTDNERLKNLLSKQYSVPNLKHPFQKQNRYKIGSPNPAKIKLGYSKLVNMYNLNNKY